MDVGSQIKDLTVDFGMGGVAPQNPDPKGFRNAGPPSSETGSWRRWAAAAGLKAFQTAARHSELWPPSHLVQLREHGRP